MKTPKTEESMVVQGLYCRPAISFSLYCVWRLCFERFGVVCEFWSQSSWVCVDYKKKQRTKWMEIEEESGHHRYVENTKNLGVHGAPRFVFSACNQFFVLLCVAALFRAFPFGL